MPGIHNIHIQTFCQTVGMYVSDGLIFFRHSRSGGLRLALIFARQDCEALLKFLVSSIS